MRGLFSSPFGSRSKADVAARFVMPQEEQKQAKPSFFGQGGAGRGIAGTLGDFLLQYNGFAPTYAPAIQQQRAIAAQGAADQRNRSLDLADWQYKQEYERANPKPVNNDTVNDYNFIAERLGQDVADQYLRNLGDPIVTTTLPGNRFYSGPRSQFGQALGGGPVAQSEWDSAKPYGGGTAGNGGGSFR